MKIALNLCSKSVKWIGFLNNELPKKLNLPKELKTLLLGITLSEYESKKTNKVKITYNVIKNNNAEISLVLPWDFYILDEKDFLKEIQKILDINLKNNMIKSKISYKKVKLKDSDFWKIFESESNSILDVSKKLKKQDFQFLVSFEITLRNKLINLNSEFLLKTLKKESNITDDSFLYIRLNIILAGKKVYQKVLNKINFSYLELIRDYDKGESLMYVTDEIYMQKYFNKNIASPRNIANEKLNINLI